MICSDPIADMLTRIRNGLLARKKSTIVPYSKIKEGIAQILSRLGFISDYSIEEINDFQKDIIIKLKYVNRESAILGLKRKSRPGRRIYVGSKYKDSKLPQHGVFILSTPEGILSGEEARKKGVGGELLCVIW